MDIINSILSTLPDSCLFKIRNLNSDFTSLIEEIKIERDRKRKFSRFDQERYNRIRFASEKLWKQLWDEVRASKEYSDLKERLDQYNNTLDPKTDYYKCFYEIHPEDLGKANFESYDRGGYLDTTPRSVHIPGGIFLESSRGDFPMPGEKVGSIIIVNSQLKQEFGERAFPNHHCIVCGGIAPMPLGFFCSSKCGGNPQKTDPKILKEYMLKQIEFELRCIQNTSYSSFEEASQADSVECCPFLSEEEDEDDVEIRFRLESYIKLENVCSEEEHDFEDGIECTNCGMFDVE